MSQIEGIFLVKDNKILIYLFLLKMRPLNITREYFLSRGFPFLPLGKVKHPDNLQRLKLEKAFSLIVKTEFMTKLTQKKNLHAHIACFVKK